MGDDPRRIDDDPEHIAGDPKRIVGAGYDRCALAYTAARKRDPSPELARLIEQLPRDARVLDIGCGAGIPVMASLARVARVVGVDISRAQIALARETVAHAGLVHGDIMKQAFDDASFDAIVAFYAIFHLPREEHAELLDRVRRWLRPGGHLLATLPSTDASAYTEDFFGVKMYWSHFQTSWYAERLCELGFEILQLGAAGSGYRTSDLPAEHHPIVLARRV